MKTLSVTFLIFFLFTKSYCQDTRDAHVTLVVDEELAVGSISNIKIKNNRGRTTEVGYYPGRLIFDRQDFEALISRDDTLTLNFDYSEFSVKEVTHYNYKLPFAKEWLTDSFIVLKVYNLDKKKYKNVFAPLNSSCNYSLEEIGPRGQVLRLKKPVINRRKK